MHKVQVVSIDLQTHDQIEFVNKTKITYVSPFSSLAKGDLTNFAASLNDLFKEIGIIDAAETELPIVAKSNISNDLLNFSKASHPDNTVQYFLTMLWLGWERANFTSSSNNTIVLDLTNFLIPPTTGKRLAEACYDFENNVDGLKKFNLLVLVERCVNAFEYTKEFDEYILESKFINIFAALDTTNGYFHVFDNSTGRVTGSSMPQRITKTGFNQGILYLSKGELFHALIYQTNINIGHFVLENSHIRTHYDLTDFVRRPNVSRFIHEDIVQKCEFKLDGNDKLILGVGHERKALDNFGYGIQHNQSDVSYQYYEDSGGAPTDNIINEWLKTYSKILVLTDVVNTGSLLTKVLNRFILNEHYNKEQVSAYSIIVMENTHPLLTVEAIELKCAVKINRKFYDSNDPCLLCDIGQPILCDDVSSIRDLREYVSCQLTCLDFWEIVSDSDALIHPRNESERYRVETSKLLNKYGVWLKSVVAARLKQERIVDKPIDIILTVDEPGGLGFADLVAQSLLEFREGIDMVAHSRSDIVSNEQRGLECNSGKSFLLVDDGVNSGDTIRWMIEQVNSIKGILVGVVVLDCKLEEAEIKSIVQGTSLTSIISLYSWPSYQSVS